MVGIIIVDEDDKIIEFLMDMIPCLIFLDFLKIPIEIETQCIVLILDETFRM